VGKRRKGRRSRPWQTPHPFCPDGWPGVVHHAEKMDDGRLFVDDCGLSVGNMPQHEEGHSFFFFFSCAIESLARGVGRCPDCIVCSSGWIEVKLPYSGPRERMWV